jgi:class 3 adenylate cyclase
MAQTDTRKLAAIMFTDMVGFSRQMGDAFLVDFPSVVNAVQCAQLRRKR